MVELAMKHILKIFVAAHCFGCSDVALEIAKKYTNEVAVEIINIDEAHSDIPEEVFATPTYMLNNRIVSLGNPSPDDLERWLRDEISRGKD